MEPATHDDCGITMIIALMHIKPSGIDTAGWRHILWSAYDHAASAGEVKSAARIRYGCDPRLLPGNMIMTSHHSTKSVAGPFLR
jgi:hypothetical protein